MSTNSSRSRKAEGKELRPEGGRAGISIIRNANRDIGQPEENSTDNCNRKDYTHPRDSK
jgi:hypothetical protein